MSSELPQDREKALAAIARGWGREATAAHPLCRCGKPKPPLPELDVHAPDWNAELTRYHQALAAYRTEHGLTRSHRYEPRDCPVHGGPR